MSLSRMTRNVPVAAQLEARETPALRNRDDATFEQDTKRGPIRRAAE